MRGVRGVRRTESAGTPSLDYLVAARHQILINKPLDVSLSYCRLVISGPIVGLVVASVLRASLHRHDGARTGGDLDVDRLFGSVESGVTTTVLSGRQSSHHWTPARSINLS